MFIKNQYLEEYYIIINDSKKHNRVKNSTDYFEEHHIIPISLGGSNEKSNLVLLTYEEHYRCHELLPMFTKGKHRKSMLYAWNFMKNSSKEKKIRMSFNNIFSGTNNPMYGKKHTEESKKKISLNRKHIYHTEETKSKISKSVSGTNNPMYGKKHTEESKKKMSGKNRSNFKGYYKTPFGILESSYEIKKYTSYISANRIRKICTQSDRIITRQSRNACKYLKSLEIDIIGKSFKDIGFDFIKV